MACGIGGRTVEEAKRSMSYAEFLAWCEYRNRQGCLHQGMRIDRAVSRLMAAYFNAHSKGKSFKPMEFSPYDASSSRVDVEDPEAMFTVLKGLARGKSRNTDD